MTQSDQLRQRFDRTTCDCKECLTCCEHMPGVLAPGDLELIGEHLGEENNEFVLEHFRASEGATAMKQDPVTGETQLIQIPTIVPAQKEDGSCVFLKDGRCSIHAVAPFGCSYMDTHQSFEEGQPRSNAIGLAQMADWQQAGPYARAWSLLAYKGKMASPLLERKQNLINAMDAIPDGEKKSNLVS